MELKAHGGTLGEKGRWQVHPHPFALDAAACECNQTPLGCDILEKGLTAVYVDVNQL